MWQFALAPVFVILLEHVGRLHEWTYRPSWALTQVARAAEAVWEFIGRVIGHTLRILNVLETLHDLWLPCRRILLSPVWLIRGYMAAVENPWLHAGAAICVAALTWALYLYFELWALALPVFIVALLIYDHQAQLWAEEQKKPPKRRDPQEEAQAFVEDLVRRTRKRATRDDDA